MSVSVGAYAIIGVPVDLEDLYKVEHVSVHLECSEKGPGGYCSSCGKPVDETERVETPLEGYDPEGGPDYEGDFRGLPIMKAYWGDEARCFIAGASAYDDSDHGYHDDKAGPRRIFVPAGELSDYVAKLREILKERLESVGLWKPEEFGIWVAAHYSS